MDIRKLNEIVVKKVDNVYTSYTEANNGAEARRENWSLILKIDGLSHYVYNGKLYVSDRSHAILIPRGCNYSWYCEKSGSVAIIAFESDMECDEIFSLRLKDATEFLRLFRNMEVERLINPVLYEMRWRKNLYEMLLLLLSQQLEPEYISGRKMEKIRPAIEYIANNYKTNITNDILSKQCDISTVYFRKLFTEVFGISPRIYILQLRIDIAKRMLRMRTHPKIEDIALDVGYCDIYQFCKMFKKYTGVTPKKYSKSWHQQWKQSAQEQEVKNKNRKG